MREETRFFKSLIFISFAALFLAGSAGVQAQELCEVTAASADYDCSTVPQQHPIVPWVMDLQGHEEPTSLTSDGEKFHLYAMYDKSDVLFFREEESIATALKYELKLKVHIADYEPSQEPDRAFVGYGFTTDGEKAAAIITGPDLENGNILVLLENDQFYVIEGEADWFNPTTYRILVDKTLPIPLMKVYVDKGGVETLVAEIPYDDLVDANFGTGSGVGFGGHSSYSVWDFVRYEICAPPLEGPPPIEDQIEEIKNEIDQLTDAPDGLKNKLKNELDKIINIEDPHEQGLRLLWISERLFQARFSGAAKMGTERVATRLDFARDTVAPGISRYNGYRGYLNITSVEQVSNVVRPDTGSARYAVTIELDPISRHINNEQGNMFGFFLRAGGIDIANGELVGIRQTFYELPMQLDRLNKGEVYTIGPLNVTFDGLTEDLLPVEPDRRLFIGGTIEYAELSRADFDVITHIDSSSFTTWDGESERGTMVPRIRDRQPETELVWDRYISDPAIARNSFAAGSTHCSGVMLGPNVYATASHCNRARDPAPTITFKTYKGAAATSANIETETYNCDYLVDTENDTDLELFYCHPNAGVNPGDKYGYAEPTFDRPEFGDQVYSIWQNSITSEGRSNALLYSEGEITGWHSFPDGYAHASRQPGVPLCLSPTCTVTPPFADFNQGDQVRTAMDTNVWSFPGASGSVQFDSITHRMVLGPTTSVSGRQPNGGPIKGALNWFDWMDLGWIPDANILGTFQYPGIPGPTPVIIGNNDKLCFGCFGTAVVPATNDAFLQAQFGLNGANYRGRLLDTPRNMVIDIQEDIERIQGESNRDYYFPWFGSARCNAQWESSGDGTAFISDFNEKMVISNDAATTTTYRLRTIPFDTGARYLVRFDTYFSSYSDNTIMALVIKNTGTWYYHSVEPHTGWRRHTVVVENPPQDGYFEFLLDGIAGVHITQFVVMKDNAKMDFDTNDARRRWEYVSDNTPAPILPIGYRDIDTIGSDWAGLVTREVQDRAMNMRHYGIVFIQGMSYEVCFKHRFFRSDQPLSKQMGIMKVIADGRSIGQYEFPPRRLWATFCRQFTLPSDSEWVQIQFSTESGFDYLIDEIEVSLLD